MSEPFQAHIHSAFGAVSFRPHQPSIPTRPFCVFSLGIAVPRSKRHGAGKGRPSCCRHVAVHCWIRSIGAFLPLGAEAFWWRIFLLPITPVRIGMYVRAHGWFAVFSRCKVYER
jgi:hypothetical protein